MPGLLERLNNGEDIVIAEGYLWEMERRCFAKFGIHMPTVAIDRPSALRNLHEEFALAGSDVIEAFTYLAHRDQFRRRGRESDLEKVNRDALRIAREVADEFGKLMAGNLSNTPLYKPDDKESHAKLMSMFREQVEWAVEGGADYIIGETFNDFGEAMIALEAIKQYGNDLPAVITLTAYAPDVTTDDVPIPEACRRLEEAGAAVVGINCARGPDVMIPLVKKIRDACKGPIAALPVGYRTTEDRKPFTAAIDPLTGEGLYPDDLDCLRCNKSDIRRFGAEARKAGVQYVGLCCGNAPNLTRELAQAYGRRPPASDFTADHNQSWIFGETTDERMLKLRSCMLGTHSTDK